MIIYSNNTPTSSLNVHISHTVPHTSLGLFDTALMISLRAQCGHEIITQTFNRCTAGPNVWSAVAHTVPKDTFDILYAIAMATLSKDILQSEDGALGKTTLVNAPDGVLHVTVSSKGVTLSKNGGCRHYTDITHLVKSLCLRYPLGAPKGLNPNSIQLYMSVKRKARDAFEGLRAGPVEFFSSEQLGKLIEEDFLNRCGLPPESITLFSFSDPHTPSVEQVLLKKLEAPLNPNDQLRDRIDDLTKAIILLLKARVEKTNGE